MGKKSKKKRAKKRKSTMLPPSVDAGASTQQQPTALATLAAEASAHDRASMPKPELVSAAVPADTPTHPHPAESGIVQANDVEVEHRASRRASLEVELHLASDSHFFSGLSGDISEGGVFVSTYRDLKTGTLVDLEFSLPGSDRVMKAKGEVKWHRSASPGAPPGVGIEFEELADEDRAIIHRFCTLRPPLYYDDVG